MGLNVGTLVQPYNPPKSSGMHETGRTCFLEDETDQCIGIVLSLTMLGFIDNEPKFDVKVRWVQICPYHLESLTTVGTYSSDSLWDIGQCY